MRDTSDPPPTPVYSPTARLLHWLTVAVVAVMIPVGLTMVYRGKALNLWDGTTNALYSGHKLAGLVLLAIVLVRLASRLVRGAPPDEPSLEPWQRTASHAVHWLLYLLLIVMPVLGWIGVSMFPALDVFGLFKLPALTVPNSEGAKLVLTLHRLCAFALLGLIGLHIAAALFHHFVRKDGVLARMLPGLSRSAGG
jgi:cytochrome b561